MSKSTSPMDGNEILSEMKYKYHLQTWGGFYNEWYKAVHHQEEGDFWFDTEKERDDYLKELETLCKEMESVPAKFKSNVLAHCTSEGYNCYVHTKLHRVVEWEGKRYYSEYDLGINYPFDSAQYHLDWKWTPGFNDYPLGDDFDYETNQVTIIQEWITGAFSPDLESRANVRFSKNYHR